MTLIEALRSDMRYLQRTEGEYAAKQGRRPGRVTFFGAGHADGHVNVSYTRGHGWQIVDLRTPVHLNRSFIHVATLAALRLRLQREFQCDPGSGWTAGDYGP